MDNNINIQSQQPSELYMACDGDNAGRLVGRAVLANDEQALSEVSSRISLGGEIISRWVEEQGGRVISSGGDEGTFVIPANSAQNIEQLRSDYQFSTQLTMTVGIGSTLSEAGKSLMAGKFRGKDQVVTYDPSVDSDIAAASDHVASGNGTEEENKLDEAYLSDNSAPAPASSHTDDCQYCQDNQDHDHTDDCQYCAAAEETPADDHSHTDDCQYCAAKEQIDNHDHTDDCEWCATAEQRAADADHDHTDDCQYCAAKETPQAQSLAQGILTDDPNTQSERDQINNMDDTQMPLGNEMEGNVSHTEGYDSEMAPQDMGLSEDASESDSPDLGQVLQGGLDAHAENIGREKVVAMVSQALDGFKANKQLLEKAKEQAPDLYSSTIMMLKAMIEMAKQLGLGGEPDQPQEPQQESQGAAPQEGAAQSPQQ